MTKREFFQRLSEIASEADIPTEYWSDGAIKKNDRATLQGHIRHLIINYSDKDYAHSDGKASWQQVLEIFAKYKVDPWAEFKDQHELREQIKKQFYT